MRAAAGSRCAANGRRIQRQIRAGRRTGGPGADRLAAADDGADAQVQAHVKRAGRTEAGVLDEYLRAPSHVDAAHARPASPAHLHFDAGGSLAPASASVGHIAAERYPQPPHAARIQALANGLDAHHIHAAQAKWRAQAFRQSAYLKQPRETHFLRVAADDFFHDVAAVRPAPGVRRTPARPLRPAVPSWRLVTVSSHGNVPPFHTGSLPSYAKAGRAFGSEQTVRLFSPSDHQSV